MNKINAMTFLWIQSGLTATVDLIDLIYFLPQIIGLLQETYT